MVSISATKYTVPYDEGGTIKDGTNITVTATSQNITSAQYQFYSMVVLYRHGQQLIHMFIQQVIHFLAQMLPI